MQSNMRCGKIIVRDEMCIRDSPQILNAVVIGRYGALYIMKIPGIKRLCGDQKGFRSSWMSKSLGFVFLALEYHTCLLYTSRCV